MDGGAVPPSLTSDGLHYSTATREQVLAPFIISELATRGWVDTTTESQEPTMPYTPKTDWKTDDKVDHDHLNTLEQALADAVTGAATATDAKETAAAAAQSVADLREAVESKADSATVTAALANKVDVKGETSKNTVYGISNGGNLYMYPTGVSTVAASTVAMRGTNGVLKVGEPTADDNATTKKYVDTAVGGAKTPDGTREQLDAGTDTTVRAFSAKDISDFVKAQIAALAQPKA